MIPIVERLQSNGSPLIYDAAKGTNLAQFADRRGDPTDLLNISNPEAVRNLHYQFVEAGAQMLETNTFRSNAITMGEKAFELNRLGAQIARSAAGNDVYIAGVIGPTGRLLKPNGPMTDEECVAAFIPQIKGLLSERNVDLIHLETMYDTREILMGIKAVKEVNPQIPIMVSMTFETSTPKGMRTMMGKRPSELVTIADQNGLLAYGANCGKGLEGVDEIVKELKVNHPDSVIVTKMNAGVPHLDIETEHEVYPGTPQIMAEYALRMRDLGVGIIGACCGNTPRHLEAIANALTQSS